jgi:hypothetical protein
MITTIAALEATHASVTKPGNIRQLTADAPTPSKTVPT